MDFWSQIIPRRRSEFSRPRLAVFCGQKTLLRLTKAKKTGAVQSFWAHAFVPRGGFEPYRFSTPIGYIFSQAQNIAQSGFESFDQNKKLGTRPSFLFLCPVEDSNLRPSP